MKDTTKKMTPFFAKFLEDQGKVRAGAGDSTHKYPSDTDEFLIKF